MVSGKAINHQLERQMTEIACSDGEQFDAQVVFASFEPILSLLMPEWIEKKMIPEWIHMNWKEQVCCAAGAQSCMELISLRERDYVENSDNKKLMYWQMAMQFR